MESWTDPEALPQLPHPVSVRNFSESQTSARASEEGDENGEEIEGDGDGGDDERNGDEIEPSSSPELARTASPSSSSSGSSSASSPTSQTFNPSGCRSLDCGVDEPHELGFYMYEDDVPSFIWCEPFPWGDSQPTPNVHVAHWLVSRRRPCDWRSYSIFRHPGREDPIERENRDLVANFMAHHGWWGDGEEQETLHFTEWQEYRDWTKFREWRERRLAGLA